MGNWVGIPCGGHIVGVTGDFYLAQWVFGIRKSPLLSLVSLLLSEAAERAFRKIFNQALKDYKNTRITAPFPYPSDAILRIKSWSLKYFLGKN